MSIRKRSWTAPDDTTKEAWVVNYTDADGNRRLKTFQRKRDADTYQASAVVALANGTHIADRASATVAAAGELWLKDCDQRNLKRTSIVRNEHHSTARS
jgi:hypothetical protein